MSSCSLVSPYNAQSKCTANLNGTPYHELAIFLEDDLHINNLESKVKAVLPKGVYLPYSKAGKCKFLLYVPQKIQIDVETSGFWNKFAGNKSKAYTGGLFFKPEEHDSINGFWYYQTGSNAGYNSYGFDNEINYKFVKISELQGSYKQND